MNKQILFVMRSLDNPELFTLAEKEANGRAAAGVYAAAYAAALAYAAADVYATAYLTVAVEADGYTKAEYWVNEFFSRTGQDKQTYINEVTRLKGE